MKKTRVIKSVVWIIAGIVAGYLVWQVVPRYFHKPPEPGSIEFLRQESAGLNRSLPAQLDEKTELMATEAAPGMFIYKYRLVEIAADRVDHQKFTAAARPQLVKTACDRPETSEDFLKRGVTLRYSYFDKDKQHIATLDVKPSDCGF